MSFEFQLQQLCQQSATPTTGLSETDQTRLTAATRTVNQNIYQLSQHIDGDLVSNPIYICPEQAQQDTGFTVLRLLHNYLASLYSYNETVRILFNRYTAEETNLNSGAFTPVGSGIDTSYYGRKLSFLRGLRTDFQHGGFSCLRFTKAGTLHGFIACNVDFDCQRFVQDSGLRDPSRFLVHTNESERRRPLSFVGRFHRNTFQSFAADVNEWFDAVPA